MTCTICDWPDDEILARDPLAKAFFVRAPARPGHIAVAVITHRATLLDLEPDEAAAVLRLARRVAVAAAPLLGIEKFYLAAVGDVDPHFHIHLLPKATADARLGPYLFSPSGWQGHDGVERDRELERRIAESLTPNA